MTSPFSLNVSPRATRQISNQTYGQGFPKGCWCLAWYTACQAEMSWSNCVGSQQDQHICVTELGSQIWRTGPKAETRPSALLYSACWGGLCREKKNQEKALLVDLCQPCTENFKLPPSHLLASRNFCGGNWSGLAQSIGLTLCWANIVLCLHVYLELESRLHSFRAQAGSTTYSQDCVMLCLR